MNNIKSQLKFLITDRNLTDNKTDATKNSSYIYLMFKDPEENICYYLQSLSMPEELINLNAVAVGHRPLNLTRAQINAAFDRLHSILYGNSSSKLIYRLG
ncbi:unnamed protein product [Rotaria socialis]|uniref:Uncharacterized protein n=1 Tax=Rotaria socialis TaxID=392032 RepID=A0A820TSH9_9BILA|nr:unnamed protein product [Rotaria socialis]CAF4564721.1 unnamed protein product [Rotaria socialis]